MGHHFFSSNWMSQLMEWGYGRHNMIGVSMLFRMISIILFLLLIFHFLIKKRQDSVQPIQMEETPLELLEKEFAKGNILEEEFLRKKSYLGFPEYRSKKKRRY